ncbi:MAG: Vitamin B12 dependent methionine synthase activation subunit, partial [Clostridia bacterium]|nr:Vitamin B12 dependent methionine synthase activation subunit [Clostridia bacterium]
PAAAMIEAWSDQVNGELRAEALVRGKRLRPRFSPGYGDFSLDCQPGLFRLLGVQKRIGVTLTDSLLMIPTKSVTAVIGISDGAGEAPAGCAACDRADCDFRNERRDTP